MVRIYANIENVTNIFCNYFLSFCEMRRKPVCSSYIR